MTVPLGRTCRAVRMGAEPGGYLPFLISLAPDPAAATRGREPSESHSHPPDPARYRPRRLSRHSLAYQSGGRLCRLILQQSEKLLYIGGDNGHQRVDLAQKMVVACRRKKCSLLEW
jgi:hypothetical protein